MVGQHQQPSQMTFIQYPVKIAPGKVNPGLLTTLLYNPHVHTFTHQTETILCWGNIGALYHTILQDMNNFEAFLDILQKYRPTLQTHITHITFYSKNLHEIAIWMKNNSYEAITTTFNKHKSQKVLYTGCFIYEHIQ